MLWNAFSIKGYQIAASDGLLGTVSDFLFSDDGWRIKWLVVDTGKWLPGRQVRIHPRALGPPDAALRHFPVSLTKQQVKESPDIATDQPVSRQMEQHLYDHYGWDPAWGETYFQAGAITSKLVPPPYLAGAFPHDTPHTIIDRPPTDSHLRSVVAMRGYHIRASDGDIGHVADFLVDDADWSLRYIMADTGNWWPGVQVLLSPTVVRTIDWGEQTLTVSLSRDQVKSSPKYSAAKIVDGHYEQELTDHYGW